MTQLLHRAAAGDRGADEELFGLVHHELRRIAAALLRRESRATIEPTALVNEAFLRLGNRHTTDWADRSHFYGVAARAMRQVLVDQARARARQKRGAAAVSLPDGLAAEVPAEHILAVHEALDRLAAIDPRRARVVELRWFGGYDGDTVAKILGVGEATVKRDWAAARAWLARALGPDR
ncbi:MAG: ECF-type sigma factor [Gemmatimonadales bacterium]